MSTHMLCLSGPSPVPSAPSGPAPGDAARSASGEAAFAGLRLRCSAIRRGGRDDLSLRTVPVCNHTSAHRKRHKSKQNPPPRHVVQHQTTNVPRTEHTVDTSCLPATRCDCDCCMHPQRTFILPGTHTPVPGELGAVKPDKYHTTIVRCDSLRYPNRQNLALAHSQRRVSRCRQRADCLLGRARCMFCELSFYHYRGR